MAHRTTFALDEATIRRLQKLSKAWHVSQAEVVRRSVEQAEKLNHQEEAGPLELLEKYHKHGSLNAVKADKYLLEAAENRMEWGRDT